MFRRGTKKRSESKSSAAKVPFSAPTSPTLPELHAAPVSWPKDFELVHPPPMPATLARAPSNASRISHGTRSVHENANVNGVNGKANGTGNGTSTPAVPSFHRPFRAAESASAGGPISEIYTARGSAFDRSPPPPVPAVSSPVTTPRPVRPSRRTIRKPRQATPTFNLMVCGASKCGKTSFLRLLLSSSDISPSASLDQRAALARFLSSRPRSTLAINTAVVELAESASERLLLSVIDTPGFDFRPGRELQLERQVNGIMKYVNDLYAETMGEEAKVIRENKGDQHIHLCIYLIDPSSFSPLPEPSPLNPPLTPDTPDAGTPTTKPSPSLSEEDHHSVALSPAELRVIKRLSTRLNVLPVIAKSDTLTDEELVAAKAAVRRGMDEYGVDAGVFGPDAEEDMSGSASSGDEGASAGAGRSRTTQGRSQPRGRTRKATQEEAPAPPESDSDSDGSTASKKPVVKLRHSRSFGSGLRRARSLSRLRGEAEGGDEDGGADEGSVAVLRFGAGSHSGGGRTGGRRGRRGKDAIAEKTPFAVVAPQPGCGRALSDLTDPSAASGAGHVDPLRGVFVRRFRWGTLDALDPKHSDFPFLRTVVLGSHMGRLRTRTREVLYEAFRTEKLLARRMTRGLSKEEADRLLEELGLMKSPSSDIGSRVSEIMDG